MTATKYYGLTVFYGMTILAGCTFNLLILLGIQTRKELRRRRANLFVCSLCLSDFFTSAYSVTYHMVHLHPKIYRSSLNVTYCRTTQFFIYALAFSSTLCLTGVCIDRYLAITKPFFYLSNRFFKATLVLLFWPWVQSFGTAIPAVSLPLINVLNYTGFPCGIKSNWDTLEVWSILSVINIILPFICILASCILVYRVAKKQLHEIRQQVPSSNIREQSSELSSSSMAFVRVYPPRNKIYTVPVIEQSCTHQKAAAKRKFNRNYRKEAKITFATIVVVIGFVIAWVPYFATRLLYLVGIDVSNDVHTFGTAFVLANSAWNPLLIILLRSDIRKSIKLLCHMNKV